MEYLWWKNIREWLSEKIFLVGGFVSSSLHKIGLGGVAEHCKKGCLWTMNFTKTVAIELRNFSLDMISAIKHSKLLSAIVSAELWRVIGACTIVIAMISGIVYTGYNIARSDSDQASTINSRESSTISRKSTKISDPILKENDSQYDFTNHNLSQKITENISLSPVPALGQREEEDQSKFIFQNQ